MAGQLTRTSIDLADLFLDAGNPRVEEASADQRTLMQAIAAEQGAKLVELARSIAELGGLDPSALVTVMEREGTPGGYVVMEGNRRVMALKMLDQPSIGEGILNSANLKAFKRISAAIGDHGLTSVPCVIFPDRESARPWIKLRHTGENKGAGTVPWDTEQSQRWDAGDGPIPSALQALDYVRKHGTAATKKAAEEASVTNVKRLLDDPYVRGQLGLEQTRGQLLSGLPRKELTKALSAVVAIASANRVKDIYTAKQRAQKVDDLAKTKRPDLANAGELRPVDPKGSPPPSKGTKRRPRRPPRRDRKQLIPHSCTLVIDNDRANDLHHELRTLKVDAHPNSVAVMLRVFLEISLDHVITEHNLAVPARKSLKNKLATVEDFLLKNRHMTKQEIRPVRSIRQGTHFLGVSVDALNDWIHSPHWAPIPADLLGGWDNLQGFFEVLWSEKL